MTSSRYDAIVLGVGGAGSAAMWRLAKRGLRVLGVDRFSPPHDRGSTHGQTRIIRQAYFEHPDYVPLLRRAYELWAELEESSGERLFERTGLVEIGPPDGEVVPGVLRAAKEHSLEVESLSPEEVSGRWPALHIGDEQVAVHEPTGGFLYVERCVEACLKQATDAGGELLAETVVHGWQRDGDGLIVKTTAGDYACDRLIVTAGPWAGGLLCELGLRLEVRRQSQLWLEATEEHQLGRIPPFLFEEADAVFYGFPAIEPWGLKACDHMPGPALETPESIDRNVAPADEHLIRRLLARRLPGVGPTINRHATCYYTMSPDGHFVVDHWPGDDRIAFAAGLSGHGFKFTPVLGEVLADLALEGRSVLPVGFLSAGRFAS